MLVHGAEPQPHRMTLVMMQELKAIDHEVTSSASHQIHSPPQTLLQLRSSFCEPGAFQCVHQRCRSITKSCLLPGQGLIILSFLGSHGRVDVTSVLALIGSLRAVRVASGLGQVSAYAQGCTRLSWKRCIGMLAAAGRGTSSTAYAVCGRCWLSSCCCAAMLGCVLQWSLFLSSNANAMFYMRAQSS